MPTFDLGELGWNTRLADNLEPGLVPARVSAAHRGAFDVLTAEGVLRTQLPGRLVHDHTDVAVGDWVGLSDGTIREVHPWLPTNDPTWIVSVMPAAAALELPGGAAARYGILPGDRVTGGGLGVAP